MLHDYTYWRNDPAFVKAREFEQNADGIAPPTPRDPMAQKVQVVLVDDLDGGSADETVTFSLDGVSYEIDLSHDNAAAFRDLLSDGLSVPYSIPDKSTDSAVADIPIPTGPWRAGDRMTTRSHG